VGGAYVMIGGPVLGLECQLSFSTTQVISNKTVTVATCKCLQFAYTHSLARQVRDTTVVN